jgi:hypothetical protein
MGRIDHGVDALALKVGREALGAAEAADSDRNRRGQRIGRRAGERENGRNFGFAGDPPRERGRLRGAAENEQAKAGQGAAP